MNAQGCTRERDDLARRLAQAVGHVSVLVGILEQLSDDMKAYHPDMHGVVRTNLDLFTTYKNVLLGQPANIAKAQRIAAGGDA